ncbi:unannotated protein [freshwater metagenome]|uniref:Unannotated protein n=1 Tax=freshwater metagenome TaxID=449393 RepID=A0A6J7UNI6_9ZZZZ|nr:hypothetical protein [Actinomycetota bacterium]
MLDRLEKLLLSSFFKIFIVLNAFFPMLFRLADVSVKDSLSMLLVANVQIFLGGLFWAKLSSRSQIELVEFVGMGGALGFGLSFTSSQLFRSLMPFSISWLIIPVFLVIASYFKNGVTTGVPLVKNENSNDILLICSGTLIALSTSWYWLISTAFAFFFWVVLRHLRESNRAAGFKQSKFQCVLVAAAIVMSVKSALHLSSLAEIRNPLWWNLRYGVSQDPDLIFFESMMQSAKNLGGGENIFFLNLKFYYHWFAFAWEATLGSLSNLAPFVVTAIAGPAIVLFIVLSLVFSIARRLSTSVLAAPSAMFSVAMLCAGPIPFLRVLMPHSFSFNFGLIFLYGLVIVILSSEDMKRSNLVMVVFVLSLCLLGSKVSFGPLLVIGIGSCFVLSLIFKKQQNTALFLSISGALAVLVSFTAIYKIGAGSGASYRISFFDILRQKANLENGLPSAVVFFSFICVLSYLLAPAVGLVFSKNISDLGNFLGLLFSVSAGLVGIALGFVLSDPSETGSYFIQGGLALLVPVAVAIMFAKLPRFDSRSRFWLFLGIAACLEAARRMPISYESFTVDSGSNYYKLAFAIVLPILIAIVSIVLIKVFNRKASAIKTARFLAIFLLVSTVGSYFGNSGKFFESGVWASQNVSYVPSEVISGSAQYRTLLLWLRNNSDNKDVVATNRYCSTSTDVPASCIAMWSLTSAITGRQMLSEGSWTVNIVSGIADEAEVRRNLVENFVNDPTNESKKLLLGYGVRWVVADFAVTNARSWGEFAEVRFKNKAGAILELVP